ncbi:hypothetical protein ABZ832_15740 [Streptantibioticus parmotrematis]|uniref:hypothetical protein n=1 Tax=Streptantibioticus parmotrematis TaxID=2873249 RepID=UPI0034075DD5
MSSGHKTLTGFVTTILALLVVILGLLTGWPPWCWAAGAGGLTVAAFALNRLLARRRQPPYPMEDLPVPPPLYQQQVIREVALPSAVPDYDFLFSATVRWTLLESAYGTPVFNPAGLAVDAVLLRARRFTADHGPERSTFVQHRLDGVLGEMLPDSSERVQAMAEDVRLMLAPTDQERLDRLSGVRKDEAVWEHERSYERSKRAYLGNDVLKDAGSAVVWMLAKDGKGEEVARTVEQIDILARLSAAANNQQVAFLDDAACDEPSDTNTDPLDGDDPVNAESEPAEPAAQDVLGPFLTWLKLDRTAPEAAMLGDRLAGAVLGSERPDHARQVRDWFGLPDEFGASPEDEGEEGWEGEDGDDEGA